MSSKNLKRWFPRLKAPLEEVFRQWSVQASKRLSQALRSPVQLDLEKIDTIQSQRLPNALGAEGLDTSMIAVGVELSGASEPWILRLDSGAVYLIIDRLLGASIDQAISRVTGSQQAALTSLDWRVASYGLEEIVHPCLDAWQVDLPISSPRVQLHPTDRTEFTDSLRVRFQLRVESAGNDASNGRIFRGEWCFPEEFISANFGRLLWGSNQAATLRVTLAKSMISRSELEQLEVGDILSTEQLASASAEIECNSDVLFRGMPGAYKGAKAVRLIGWQEPE